MSNLREKTIKKELISFKAEIQCVHEVLESFNIDNFVEFEENWEDVCAFMHSAKIYQNRITKHFKDYKKSLEKKAKNSI